jgi:hypothetical protein
MEDVIAIRVTDSSGTQHYFVTWGRVFDEVDPQPLLTAIRATAPQFGIEDISHAEVCETLQAASSEPYFYEALLSFSGQQIPHGKTYGKWKSARRRGIEAGKEIYYLGRHGRQPG